MSGAEPPRPSEPSGTKKLLFALTGFVLMPVLLVLGAEGAFRLVMPWCDPIRAFVTDPFFAANLTEPKATEGDPDLGWRLKADIKDVWWDYTTLSTNHFHLRSNAEVSATQPALRVLCLGDSVTYGYRVPLSYAEHPNDYQRTEHRYSDLLQDELRRRYPGRNIEVLTMAVPGYSTHQGRVWFEREVDNLKPDVVTILYGFNDGNEGTPDKVSLSTDVIPTLTRRIVYRSQLLVWVLRTLNERPVVPSDTPAPPSATPNPLNTPYEPPHRVSTVDYLANIRAMVTTAAAHHAKAVVIGQVYRKLDPEMARDAYMSNTRKQLARMCAADHVPYLEVPELTEAGWPKNEFLFGEDIHPDAQGHELLYKRLLALLDEQHMLTLPDASTAR